MADNNTTVPTPGDADYYDYVTKKGKYAVQPKAQGLAETMNSKDKKKKKNKSNYDSDMAELERSRKAGRNPFQAIFGK